MELRSIAMVFSLALVASALPMPASADAIDGDWCRKDGQRLSIDGPKIVTPGGKSLTGNYDRHAFSYKAPAGSKRAGGAVNMKLMDEYNLRVTWPGAKAAEVWQRCKKGIS